MLVSLEEELRKAVYSDLSLPEVVARLRHLKETAGLGQDETYHALERMRDEATNERVEDRILEVMDFVSGYCAPDKRIW